MKKSAYHFGIKLRFYPSTKQRQMIKQNYDAQRFVYNQYVGANRLIYHLKRTSKAKQLNSGLPFVMMKMTKYEIEAANRLIEQQELIAKPKNIRDKYDFLRRKEIDSLAIANAIQNYRKAWRNYRKIGHGIPSFHKKSNSWSYQTNCQYPGQKEAYLDNGTVRFIDYKHVELTGITFDWNIKQNFYSQNHLNSVNEYFTYLCSKYKSFNDFDKNEDVKISKLHKMNSTDSNLRILTVHQAKGLEFDNVYLFGFKNEDVSNELIKLDEVFSPGDKFTKFQNKINILAKSKNPELLRYLDILSDAGVDGTYELIHKLWPKGTFNINCRQFIKHEEELDGTPNFEIFPLSDVELKIIYHSAVTLSQALEDERRLLYVAVTRAKRECSINYDNDSHSPLLDELGFN